MNKTLQLTLTIMNGVITSILAYAILDTWQKTKEIKRKVERI